MTQDKITATELPDKGERLLIMVPTYNEQDNAQKMVLALEGLNLEADVLFIDDNSPDGTGRILDELATTHPLLTVLHRPGKQGVGSAHDYGIRWAYRQGYR